jgi:hypothetical protein
MCTFACDTQWTSEHALVARIGARRPLQHTRRGRQWIRNAGAREGALETVDDVAGTTASHRRLGATSRTVILTASSLVRGS